MAGTFKKTDEKKAPIYERLAEELYEKMKAGTLPWQPGFTGSFEIPRNFTTGDDYSGMNVLKLACDGVTQAATFNQIVAYAKRQESKGIPRESCLKLRKGSKGHEIGKVLTFAAESEGGEASTPLVENGDGKAKRGFSMKAYHVFNIDDCENVPAELRAEISKEERAIKGMQFADDIIEGLKATGLRFVESGDQPCYIPSLDEIRLPARHKYKDDAAWAADALHELAHATMHESRLNRPEGRGNKPGSSAYAAEERPVEISSFFVACVTGHRPSDTHFDQHASYVSSFMSPGGGGKSEFIKAVGVARGISEYLIERGLEVQQRREAAQSVELDASKTMQPAPTKGASAASAIVAQTQPEQARRQHATAGMSM